MKYRLGNEPNFICQLITALCAKTSKPFSREEKGWPLSFRGPKCLSSPSGTKSRCLSPLSEEVGPCQKILRLWLLAARLTVEDPASSIRPSRRSWRKSCSIPPPPLSRSWRRQCLVWPTWAWEPSSMCLSSFLHWPVVFDCSDCRESVFKYSWRASNFSEEIRTSFSLSSKQFSAFNNSTLLK